MIRYKISNIDNFIFLMENPESQSPPLSPRMMHSYDNHTNIPWNITQYNVPKLHFDQK